MSCASLARRLETRRVSITSPPVPGSTSTVYNSNSIAANSSRGSTIWRARHWPPLIRLARARAAWRRRRYADHVTADSAVTSVRTRAAMVYHGALSASGILFTVLVPVAVDDVADSPTTCVSERATDARGCDDHRFIATTRILLPADSHRGKCAPYSLVRPLSPRAFFFARKFSEKTSRGNRIAAGTCLTIHFNIYFLSYNLSRVILCS